MSVCKVLLTESESRSLLMLLRSSVVAALLLVLCTTGSEAAVKLGGAFRVGLFAGGDLTLTPDGSGVGPSQTHSYGASYTYGISLEQALNTRLHLTEFFDVHSIHVGHRDNLLINAGMGFVFPIELVRGSLSLRPGLSLGGAIGSSKSYFHTTDFWTVRPSAEIATSIGHGCAFVFEVSMFFTCNGGNQQYAVGLGPNLMIRTGLLF